MFPTEQPIIVAPEIIPNEEVIAEYDEPAEEIDTDELAKHYDAYEKELETMKAEVEGLKREILSKSQQLDSMSAILAENEREIKDKDLIIATYRDRIKRARFMIDNSYGVGQIMELLVTVV